MEIIHDLNFILPLAIGIFWSIVFLQSGFDKIFDLAGNLEWLNGHFSKTFLAPMVKPMVYVLTFLEILTGFVSLYGIINFLISGSTFWISQGVTLAIISLLMLIFGQRIAKDYDGAKTIAIYFGVALLSAIYLAPLIK